MPSGTTASRAIGPPSGHSCLRKRTPAALHSAMGGRKEALLLERAHKSRILSVRCASPSCAQAVRCRSLTAWTCRPCTSALHDAARTALVPESSSKSDCGACTRTWCTCINSACVRDARCAWQQTFFDSRPFDLVVGARLLASIASMIGVDDRAFHERQQRAFPEPGGATLVDADTHWLRGGSP